MPAPFQRNSRMAGGGRRRRVLTGALAGLIAGAVGSSVLGQSDNQTQTLRGHGGPIKSVVVDASGAQAATTSFDYSVMVWDLATGRSTARLLGHDAPVNDVALIPGTPDAVSVADDGDLIRWDLSAGTLDQRFPAEAVKVLDVDVSPDGRWAAAARWDQTIKLYDLHLGAEVATLRGHRGNVNTVVFSADGSQLLSGGYDGQILMWEVASARLIRPLHRHGWGVNSLARVGTGQLIYGALDGTVGLVDLVAGRYLRALATSDRPIQTVRASPDGTLVAYGDGAGVIEVFETATWTRQDGGPAAYGPIWDLAFLPDGSEIIHVGLDDFAIRWQIAPRTVGAIVSEPERRFQIRDTDDPGAQEFQRKCSVCHTLTPDDANRAGPTLYNLFGRQAGTFPGYTYSDALRGSDVIWDTATIGQLFDDGPDIMLPGTKMPIQRLTSVDRRDALIAFLKTATKPLE